jgi:hypothetical protein
MAPQRLSDTLNTVISVASTVVAVVAVVLTQFSNNTRAELDVHARLTQLETNQKYILLYIQELQDDTDRRRSFPQRGGIGE